MITTSPVKLELHKNLKPKTKPSVLKSLFLQLLFRSSHLYLLIAFGNRYW